MQGRKPHECVAVMKEKDWQTKLKIMDELDQGEMQERDQLEVWQAHVRMHGAKKTETSGIGQYLSRGNQREEDTEMVTGGSGSSKAPAQSQQKEKKTRKRGNRGSGSVSGRKRGNRGTQCKDWQWIDTTRSVRAQCKDVIDITEETKLIKEHAHKEQMAQAEVIDDEEQEKEEAEDERWFEEAEKAEQLRWDTDISFDQTAEKKEKRKHTEQGRRENKARREMEAEFRYIDEPPLVADNALGKDKSSDPSPFSHMTITEFITGRIDVDFPNVYFIAHSNAFNRQQIIATFKGIRGARTRRDSQKLAIQTAREAAQAANEAVTLTWEALYGFDAIRCKNSEEMSNYEKQRMWQRMMTHLTPYSAEERQEVWQERQDVWQEMCTNWQIEQIIYAYIADAYHRTEERARRRAIDVEMEVNDYCEDMYRRIAAKQRAIQAARAASRCCQGQLRKTIEIIKHIEFLQDNSRRLAYMNKQHFKMLRTSHRAIVQMITKTRGFYDRDGREHDTEEHYLQEYGRLTADSNITEEEEEQDEQTRYDNQFETTLINWENIFITIERATKDPFMATPAHPNTGLGYTHQRTPISHIWITGEGETTGKIQFVMGTRSTDRDPLLRDGKAHPPPPPLVMPLRIQEPYLRRHQLNVEAEAHEIDSRRRRQPTRFVDRIVLPSEGENDEGMEGMRQMMRRERERERDAQITLIYEFQRQIYLRHIYPSEDESQPSPNNKYSRGEYSRFANDDADFEDRGHLGHESDWKIDGFIIETDEGIQQWEDQQEIATSNPEDLTSIHVDDYLCRHCGKWQETTRMRWHEPSCLHNPLIQESIRSRKRAFRNDEWMIASGVNLMRPRDVTRWDRWIYTHHLGKQQPVAKINHHTGKSIVLPCTPHTERHGYDTLQEWFMTDEGIDSQGGRRIGGWKCVYDELKAYHNAKRDTTTNIVDMGPPLEEWDRDRELAEKRNIPGWSQTHEQFNRIDHRQHAPNNPRRQTTVPTTSRLLREPAGSENDRLKVIARIFEHKSHQAFEQQRRFWRSQYSSTKFNRYSTSEALERYNCEDIGRLSRRMPPFIIAEIWSYLEMNAITDYNSEQSEIAILAARHPIFEVSFVRYDMLPTYGRRHVIEMSLMKTHKKENLQDAMDEKAWDERSSVLQEARYAMGGYVYPRHSQIPHIIVEGETEIIEEELFMSGFKIRWDLHEVHVWAIPFERDLITAARTWTNEDIQINMSRDIEEVMRS